MTFALTPAQPYVAAVSKVEASDLNYYRTAISQALDGTGGSGGVAYTPITPIIINGAGLQADPFSGAVRGSGTGTASTTVSSLSNNVGLPTSTINVASTTGFSTSGSVWISNGTSLYALVAYSGVTSTSFTGCSVVAGFGTLTTGASVTAGTAILVDSSAALAVNGTALLANGSSLVVANNGSIQLFPGASLSLTGANLLAFSGSSLVIGATASIEVNASGLVEIQNSARLQVDSGGTLQCNSGSTATLAGTNTFSGTNALSGATTQSALYTKSGAAARTALRTTTLNSDSNLNVDPSQWDFIEIDASGFTADRTWTFTAPPGGICCTVMLKANTSSPWSHGLTIGGGIVGPNGGLFVYNPGAGGQFSGWNLLVYDPIFAEWRGIGVPFNAINTPY